MNMECVIGSECHVIPVPGNGDGEFIIYFPLQSLSMKVNGAAADLISRARESSIRVVDEDEIRFFEFLEGLGVLGKQEEPIPDFHTPEKPSNNKTMLLLSDSCNLDCVYCYSDPIAEEMMMPEEIAFAAVDTIIRNARNNNQDWIEIGFHGGGEPTLNWSVLTGVVEYARQEGRRKGLKVRTAICTNGIIPVKKVVYLAEYIDQITVSFDGPPEIQNRQRPVKGGGASYHAVARTLDKLDSLGKPYMFRVTITDLSQSMLPKIYDHMADRFNPRAVCIEPVFVCGRCTTSSCSLPDAEAFLEGYRKTFSKIGDGNPGLQYSGGRLFLLDSSFCGTARGNFFVTPRGDVTSCLEISFREDPRAEVFMYGRYNRGKGTFEYDMEKYNNLLRLRVQNFETCRDCFARWHCSGDCPAKAPDMRNIPFERNQYRCDINREITLHQLLAETQGGESVPARGGQRRTVSRPS